jgi:hypothetical protein
MRASPPFDNRKGRRARDAPHMEQLNHAQREAISPVERIQHALHRWVAFAIMPLFAFANAGSPSETPRSKATGCSCSWASAQVELIEPSAAQILRERTTSLIAPHSVLRQHDGGGVDWHAACTGRDEQQRERRRAHEIAYDDGRQRMLEEEPPCRWPRGTPGCCSFPRCLQSTRCSSSRRAFRAAVIFAGHRRGGNSVPGIRKDEHDGHGHHGPRPGEFGHTDALHRGAADEPQLRAAPESTPATTSMRATAWRCSGGGSGSPSP